MQGAQDDFGALYKALRNGYWAATTIEAKDRLRGLADFVYDILSALNRQEMETRTAAFEHVAQDLVTAKIKMDKLKDEIDGIIHNVQIANSVVGAIGKASATASSLITTLTA